MTKQYIDRCGTRASIEVLNWPLNKKINSYLNVKIENSIYFLLQYLLRTINKRLPRVLRSNDHSCLSKNNAPIFPFVEKLAFALKYIDLFNK